MRLNDVMDTVAAQLDRIAGLRVFAYPPGTVVPPAAVVKYPDRIEFGETYGRGMDRIPDLPVAVVVGKASTRTARDRIAAYVSGSGASSVKAVLEGGTYTTFDTVTVTSCDFDVVTIAGVDYLAAMFHLDIAGSRSA